MNSDLLVVRASVGKDMYEKIVDHISTKKKSENIVVAVGTLGGLPMYAFRAMMYIRRRYKYISFVVFDMAMSAGTLMALGADVIYLADGACLGPLDLQISHPNDDTIISTLDVRDTAKQTVLEASQVMRTVLINYMNSGMPKSLAIGAAERLATELYRPIMDKIDPYHLHESYRNAELSIEYGGRLLLSGMMDDSMKAASVASALANNYTYHGYAIMEEEAKGLGLNVMNAAELRDIDSIKQVYDNNPIPESVFFEACGGENKK